MNKEKIWLPTLIGVAIAIGMWLGWTISHSKNSSFISSSHTEKLNDILQLMENKYVEKINIDSISEDLLVDAVTKLDPHSNYISKKELETINEGLNGSFSGIGVHFNIQRDTVMVISVIHGGPSERLGILPGDRIVSVNDSNFTGKGINNEKVISTLKGEKGTTVKVGIKRSSSNEILSFNIKREDVPIKSIDTYYMQTSNIGYIKISNFGGKTYQEFLVALASLKQQKATAFIIDLRGNPGGYLDAVIQMVNEFLERGDLIVYTEGRKYNREEVFADGSGSCKKDKVVILIDEFSASAAEIFAGAIQDNDRGTIIGRRSFGKGLVQQQFSLSDGSAVRLTTAKYYTPSGRCIQRPYQKGNREAYNMDIMNRYLHGEFVNKDSIKHVDTTKYYTKKRRIVYGGGGIMPDIFVAKDTIGFTPYFNKLADNGLIYSFAFKYADEHRKILQNIKQWDNLYLHLQCQPILNSFVKYAEQNGIKQNPGELHQSSKLIMHMIYSYIAQNVAEDNIFYRIYNNNDKCIEEAIKAIQQ